MHLNVEQLHALTMKVCMCPAQCGKSLRRNLANFGANVRIYLLKMQNVRSKVAKFRADLTLQQLDNFKIDNFKIDDSFGSLIAILIPSVSLHLWKGGAQQR
jgi:hypothetical protein